MKVVKEHEHGILFASYGIQDRYGLTVTVLTFFGLETVQTPLKEQDMYRFAAEELGGNEPLDASMPKQHAEFLVRGKACAPGGKPVPALEIAVQVGTAAKRLAVFGPRSWDKKGGVIVISDPKPFQNLDITWENAFGGPNFPDNPMGRGIDPVTIESGTGVRDLPNVEDPDHLIGSPEDRPAPAGFLPLGIDRPQRQQKAGTYDARWQRERWPYFPDDMDWTFFQVAPQDQQLKDFFAGGEPVSIRHMHPERPIIETSVPKYDHRAFIWQLDEPWNKTSPRTFREVILRPDTLWLFPHAMRGILVHHGSVYVADDEAFDVTHLYVATDPAGEDAKSIEDHFALFQKKLDRSIDMDMSKIEEGKQQVREAMKQIRDIPKQLDIGLGQISGKRPNPLASTATVVRDGQARLDSGIDQLEDAAKRLGEVKEKFGHMTRIDFAAIRGAQDEMRRGRQQLAELEQKTAMARQKADAMRQSMKQQALTPEGIKLASMAGVDLSAKMEELFPEPKPSWKNAAERLAGEARARLKRTPEVMSSLSVLGLRPVGLDMALFGFLTEHEPFVPEEWGLDPASLPPNSPDRLPAGLVMPRWEGSDIVGLVIRTGKFTDSVSDFIVPGSKLPPLVLGLAPGKSVLRVADPLEAALVWQDAGDYVGVIALERPDTDPGKEGGEAIAEAAQFLITLYEKGESERSTELAPWTKAFKSCEGLPLPERTPVFDAHAKGRDLEAWVLDALRQVPTEEDFAAWGMAPRAKKNGADAAGISIPTVDAGALYKHARAAIDAVIQPKISAIKERFAEGKALVRKTLEEMGHGEKFVDMELETRPPVTGNPFKQMDYSDKFARLRKNLTEVPSIPKDKVAEQLAEIDKLEARTKQVLSKSSEIYESGMAKIAAIREKGPFNEEHKAIFAMAGIDPDDTGHMTREEVVRRHAEGKSLRGKNLQGLDLSSLSLPGIDLDAAMVSGANFSKADLSGARLIKVLAEGVDFSEADLRRATVRQSMCSKGKFAGADLREAELTGNMFVGADFSGARLEQADLSGSLFQDANLTGANFTGARAAPAYFINAEMAGARLTRTTLDKSLFKDVKAGGVDFSESCQRMTVYVGTDARNAMFAQSDLHNLRILQESDFSGADLSRSDLTKASFIDSKLSEIDFRGSPMTRVYARNTDLSHVHMEGVDARQSMFHRTNLEGGSLQKANLMDGRLRKSRLTQADLSGANCYRADFFHAVVGNTGLEGANLKKTLLDKRKDLVDDKK